RVFHQDAVALDLGDLPGVRTQQEDVAGQALGDELLVERADFQIRVGDVDVVEPGVGDGAARGESQEAAAPTRVQAIVDPVPQHARRCASDFQRQRLGHGADHL